jgi:hypothetical protein
LSSTSIRKKYFGNKEIDKSNLNEKVSEYLKLFIVEHPEMFKEPELSN